jgi:hypothetical protein
MAAVKTLVTHKLLISIGNGAVPEIFAHKCLINTGRGIAFDSDQVESAVPDCDDPSLPSWRELFIDNQRANVEGAGVFHTADAEFFHDWFVSGAAKNVRVELSGVSQANGGGYWFGAFKLASWNVNGPDAKELVQATVNIMSHGVIDWADNP